MNDIINDWRPEVSSFLRTLTKAGFTLVSADNGEEVVGFAGDNQAKLVENLTACDEGWLTASLSSPEGTRYRVRFYLVLGNDPGELVCDYNYTPRLKQNAMQSLLRTPTSGKGESSRRQLGPNFTERANPMTEFQVELFDNARRKMRQLKRDGTVSMSLTNFRQVVATPKTINGAPRGADAPLRYMDIFHTVILSNHELRKFTEL